MEGSSLKILKPVRQLFKSSYLSERYYCNLRLALANRKNKEKIVIYQMGRVGSTTVLNSLQELDLNTSIFHIHFLSEDGIRRMDDHYKKQFTSSRSIHHHVIHSHYLRKQINKGIREKNWKIITLVRDPIAKNISTFFLARLNQLDYKLEDKVKIATEEEIVKELIAIFWEKHYHDAPLTWFDRELKTVFKIDVFSSEFSPKGYQIYQENSVEILLLKLESLSKIAGDAFQEFLNIKDFSLIRANSASDKFYKRIYEKFLATIVMPDSYINRMYQSKYAQHFYSEAELQKFKVKWCKLSPGRLPLSS